MDGFLRAGGIQGNLPASPTSSYLADDAASTCNLINPSPPTNALVNPIPAEQDEPLYNIGEELATKLHKVRGWYIYNSSQLGTVRQLTNCKSRVKTERAKFNYSAQQ